MALAEKARSRGEIVLAGAFADPFDKALLVFHTPNRTIPEAFAKADPYVINGLVKQWKVRWWNVVIGNVD